MNPSVWKFDIRNPWKNQSRFFFLFSRALQEAQEIFGGDFDFADFDADAYDQGEEEEEDQDEEGWDRPKKQTKRRQGRKSIFELYEPSELESSHMTDQDNEIRSTDMPERFQVCAAGSVCLNPISHVELGAVAGSAAALSCSCVQSLLNLLRMRSWRKKQSGSSDTGSPLWPSPCRYWFRSRPH